MGLGGLGVVWLGDGGWGLGVRGSCGWGDGGWVSKGKLVESDC